MQFAQGVPEVLALRGSFASDTEEAAFWARGAPVVETQELSYPGAAGQAQAMRLYRGRHNAPVLVYVHGGGWRGGSIAANDRACRVICDQSGWNILSLSYRLAPECPFPQGLEDCGAALQFIRDEAQSLGLEAGRLALGGASAGANLALSTALCQNGPPLTGLLLFYGVFAARFDSDSYRRFETGYGLTRLDMMALFDLYDPDRAHRSSPLLAPVLAKNALLRGARLPETCLIAAELDVLHDDSAHMAERLNAAGIPASCHTEPGVTHGFINRGRLVPAADAALMRAAQYLNRLEKTQ